MSVNAERDRQHRPRARRAGGRWLLLLAGLLLGLAQAPAALAATSLLFEVFRGHESIGTHRITFTKDGQQLQVDTETKVALQLVGVTVYSYSHRGHEVWSGAYLQSLETRTDDDGTAFSVSGRRTAEGFAVEGSAGSYLVSEGVIPGSYWNSDLLETNALIDIETGQLFEIEVEDRGQDIVRAAGEEVRAQRFRVKGKRVAHLWYDSAGLVVKMAFESRGEYIEHRLREIVEQ